MRRSYVVSTLFFFGFLNLMACGKSEVKEFKPVVTKSGAEVKAITAEEAKTVCQNNYCEDNQVYVAHFGHKKHDDPAPDPQPQKPGPAPQPTAPGPVPPQPSEQLDYSRRVLDMTDAWKITEGSPDVTVAVIDSGIDYFHPDLAANILVGSGNTPGFAGDIYGWDFYNNRPNGYDDNGHGTHCAGIIAAVKNGIGIRGIAPNVKVLPVKFLGADGSGDTADAVNAINYAVARGAKVLSNSWGGGGYSQLLNDTIQAAINQGVIFVAAAGNDGVDIDGSPSYPASYPGVIAVGSSDQSDERSSFSNYGTTSVEVFAPGTAIYSTYPNGQYKTMSGTSMATPQVSGALALAVSLKKTLSPAQAASDLCQSATPILTDDSKCGRMDVADLVKRVSQE